MKPIKKIYNNRVYWVLQSGWTNVAAEILWQQQKLDCVIKFKKHNIYLSNEARCYISFRGSCTECAAIIECILFKILAENVMLLLNVKLKMNVL